MRFFWLRHLLKAIATASNRRPSCGNRPRTIFPRIICRPVLETLETRVVPTTYTWINPGSGLWDNPANWSPSGVPNGNVTVIISTTAAATITLQAFDTETVTGITLASDDTLAIGGGTLNIEGTATLAGDLSMTGGTLKASGTSVTVSVSGSTNLNGGSLYAVGGATLSLPTLASYTGPVNATSTLEATGANSALTLDALTSLTADSTGTSSLVKVEALSSGAVYLRGLQALDSGPVEMVSNGVGSYLDLTYLATFYVSADTDYTGSLQVTNGGTLLDNYLSTLNDVNLTLDGSEDLSSDTFTTFMDGILSLTGGTQSFPSVSVFNGSSFLVTGGASLTLSSNADTTYTGVEGQHAVFEATGANSELTFTNVHYLKGDYDAISPFLEVEALDGGTIHMPSLQDISAGPVLLESDGANSTLDISGLGYFTGAYASDPSQLQIENNGTMDCGDLTNLNNVDVTVDDTATWDSNQIQDLNSGSLALEGGTLTLPNLDNGSINSGSSYIVSGGGTLTLPAFSFYEGNLGYQTTLEATGANSTLSLPNATALYVGNTAGTLVRVEALAGGTVSLPLLQTINTSTILGPVAFESDGAGSTLDVPDLTSFTVAADTEDAGSLQVTNGGTIIGSGLTSLANINLILDGTGTWSYSQITSYTEGTLTLTGGTLNWSSLTDIDGSSFLVSGGATLTLSGAASYAGWVNETGTFEATGANTELSLPNLTQLTPDNTAINSFIEIEARAGGNLNLPLLPSIVGGPVLLESDGSNSILNLPDLTSFVYSSTSYQNNSAGIQATNGGTITGDGITSLDEIDLTLDGTGTWSSSQITSYTDGTMALLAGTFAWSSVTDIDGSSFIASGGAMLTMTGATSYTGWTNEITTLEATGADSLLSFPNLTRLTGDNAATDSFVKVESLAGGEVDLPLLQTASGGPVLLESDGTNSLLKIPDLTSYTYTSTAFNYYLQSGAGIQVTNNGTIAGDGITTLNEINVTLDGTGTWSTSQLTSYTDGTFALTGDTLALTNVTDIDGSSFFASGGATLTIPFATTYAGWADATTNFQASGTGSTLSFPDLTNISGDTTANTSFIQIEAISAGTVSLRALQSITGGATLMESDGANSLIDASALLNYADSTTQSNLPGIELIDSGSIQVGQVSVSIPKNGYASTIDVNLPSGIAAPIILESSGSLSGGTTIDVSQGLTVEIEEGAFSGGATFNVPNGATVDLTGGNTVTYSGTLTGTGGGTVQLSNNDTLVVGAAGLTLDFSGTMFQWTGGYLKSTTAEVTNLGTINISGSNNAYINTDGIFDDYGTMIQTGTGNLVLDNSDSTPTLTIESTGSYLIDADSGLTNSNTNAACYLNNAGTINKTGGSGDSPLEVRGQINNTGTIEASSGELDIDPNADGGGYVEQMPNGSGELTGGTWNALAGALLVLPNEDIYDIQAGSVTISGKTAEIVGIDTSLRDNSGNFSILNGATYSTVFTFHNFGNLMLGGLFTSNTIYESTSATLNILIGGNPASGLFGQIDTSVFIPSDSVVTLTLINGFAPTIGDSFPVFANISSQIPIQGLSPYFTESLSNAPNLDLVDTSYSAIDLAPTSVSAPTSATVGQQVTVNWNVANQGAVDASGSWQDSVYMSTTDAITTSSTLLGSSIHSGGLAAGQTYQGSLTATLPAMSFGDYFVLVQVDSADQVSVMNRAGLTLAAAQQLDLTLPNLTLGSASNATFAAADQEDYYQITVPAGGSLTFTVQSSASSGALALYVSQGSLPSPYNYQYAGKVANQPDQTVTVPSVPAAATYYVLVYSVSGQAATSAYSITATQTPALSVTAISPNTGANAGSVTVEIDGTNFSPSITATLTNGTTTVPAAAIDFVNASQIFATFNLLGVAPNNYTVSVRQGGGQPATAPAQFQVTASGAQPLNVVLVTPQFIRSGETGTIVISYTNPTSDDIAAPLLVVTSTNSQVWFSTPDDPNNFTQSGQVLAVASNGPAGILRPGQGGELTLTILSKDPTDNDQIPIQLGLITPNASIAWAAQEAGLQPSNVASSAWNTIWNNLTAELGTTTNSYNAALANAATYLSSLGETTAQVSDVGRLWGFLESQASASFPNAILTSPVDDSLPASGSLALAIDRSFASSLASRSQTGIFGLGWTTPWQELLSVDSSGTVNIASNGSLNQFFPQTNGTYLNTQAEAGTLTLSDGIYTLTAANGTQYVFLANGFLNYEQDTNGNRITLSYNAQNQPIVLTWSNPGDAAAGTEQLALSYNAQGFVSTVTDSAGAIWTYNYDADGHLLSVVAPGGLTTSYSYDTGNNPETANALLSITNPNGSMQNFTYDSDTGRLTGTSQNGDADAINYTYPVEGEVVATDSAGSQTTIWYNDLGLPARIEDPLGALESYDYNSLGEITTYTDQAGDIDQYTYDANGNLTKSVNALGQTVQLTYGPLDELTSITDPSHLTTQYSYSSNGNLLSITYPDQSQQTLSYDPLGNLTETVGQNGDVVADQYNAMGLLALQTFADSTSQSFTYDGHGNMLKAITYNASGAATGTTTLTYNSAEELLSIVYPSGLSLTFTYNSLGQRTSSVDQSGFSIDYHYDALGRLTELTGGLGNLIVLYNYNNLGQLAEKVNGNGTYTTYAYDADGNMTDEVNYANATTINSSFAVTYNSLGEQTSVTGASGTVTYYSYDASGQLTGVILPGGQTVTYAYNADGDQSSISTSGTTIPAASNSDNEVVFVGSTVYTYSANGNLQSSTDSSGTTTYSFNDLNQLVSTTAPNGTVTSYQYSPLGYLVGTSTASTQTNYLVDPQSPSEIVSAYSNSTLVADYIYGQDENLVSQTGPSGTGYYDFDPSGNTVGITGSSDSYVDQYSTLPFGQVTTVSAAMPNPFTFAGLAGILSIGNNLFAMRNRIYNAVTDQFVSNDPSDLHGGDANIRRYVGNDPINRDDPTGLGVLHIISGSTSATTTSPALPPPTTVSTVPGMPTIAGATINPSSGKGSTATTTSGSGTSGNVTSNDPNILLGPGGYGQQEFLQPDGTLAYTVQFENDGAVAAQDVTITEQLDANLNWSSFQLSGFSFGSINIAIPSGLTQYQTTVSYQNSDGSPLNVLVTSDFSVQTGLLTVTFVSLDPTTNETPTGVFDGFLPPNDSTGIGQGFIQYTIQPNSDLTTGTTIDQRATLVFDTNAPIVTNAVTNTIDAGVPTSQLSPLPLISLPTFTVNWSGQGDAGGSGIASYNVYVSTNGGAWAPWQMGIAATSAQFAGQAGHTYAFYVTATSHVGSQEAYAPTVQAQTVVPALAINASEEENGTPAATSISSILGTNYTDPNASTSFTPGIAITELSGSGTWQYSANGTLWTTVGSVSQSAALLLPKSDSVRFEPAPNSTGTAQFSFFAWNGSEGTAGSEFNITATGGATPFSTNGGLFNMTIGPTPIWVGSRVSLTPVLTGSYSVSNTSSPAGNTVASVFGSVFQDASEGVAVGVAVTGLTGTGTWQYSLNAGSTWTTFPTVSSISALVLAASDLIRFVPSSTAAGSATLAALASDGSIGTPGTQVDPAASSAAFSATTIAAACTINTAPTLSTTTLSLAALPANTTSAATLVSSWLTQAGYSDPDGKKLPQGIAIVAASGTVGSWQYLLAGGTWTAVPAVSTSATLLLPSTASVRFVSNDSLGTATLSFKGWDETQGAAGSTYSIAANGGASAFSTATTAVTQAVRQTLGWTVSSGVTLPTLLTGPYSTTNASAPAGSTITSVFGSYFLSNNPAITVGAAVTKVMGSGTWQYSLNGGTSWTTFPKVSATAALLLVASDRIRFVPNANVAGTAMLVALGWDGSVGTHGTTVNPAKLSSAAFSASSIAATCSVNAAPSLSTTALTLASLPTTTTGSTVEISTVLTQAGYTDPDGKKLPQGIAIVGESGTVGSWQYLLSGGNWTALPTVSASSALLLPSTASVRFVSNDTTGTAALSLKGWDETQGAAGSTFDIAASGGDSAFSTVATTASLTVNPSAIPAPALGASSVALAAVNENATSKAVTVSTLLSDASASDSAGKTVKLGIAILGSSGPGTWQWLNGSTWTALPAVSGSTALLLASTNQVRFVPANTLPVNTDGAASFTYRAWDQTAGSAGTTFALSSVGGVTAFSSAAATASMAVNFVKRAPSWQSGASISFPPVLGLSSSNPNPNPAGSTVASLFGAAFSDAPGVIVGIAVTATTGTFGTWQYSTNGGTSWVAFPTVSTSAALLLAGTDLIRFLPTSADSGLATLAASAWDGSSGTVGGTANLSGKNATGGTTAFSATSLTATCLVNTAPLLG